MPVGIVLVERKIKGKNQGCGQARTNIPAVRPTG